MVEAKGIFPGAKVVRGHDWRWKNQDGKLIAFIVERFKLSLWTSSSNDFCHRWSRNGGKGTHH